jgi:hypothetical protein
MHRLTLLGTRPLAAPLFYLKSNFMATHYVETSQSIWLLANRENIMFATPQYPGRENFRGLLLALGINLRLANLNASSSSRSITGYCK